VDVLSSVTTATDEYDHATWELAFACQVFSVGLCQHTGFVYLDHKPFRGFGEVAQVGVTFTPGQSVQTTTAYWPAVPVRRFDRSRFRPLEPVVTRQVGIAGSEYEHC
jgi:hypothetical protein